MAAGLMPGISRRQVLSGAAAWAVAGALGGGVGCAGRGGSRLVIYAAGPAWLAEAAAALFEEKTGEAVELFSATTGQIMAKLQAERYNRRADVVILASRLAGEYLKQEALLEPYPPAHKPIDDGDDPGHTYHTSASAAVGIAVRMERATDDLGWDDLLSGRFAGRVVMPAPSRSGTAADFVLNFIQLRGEDGWAQLLSAKRAGLEIGGANNQAIGGLLTGAYDAIFAAADYLILRQVERDAPVRLIFPRAGVPVVQRPIAILRGTRRLDAARAFVDLYFTEAIQERVADGHLVPALPTVPISAQRHAAGEMRAWPLDVAAAMRDQPRVLRRFQYEVERAVVPRMPQA